MAVMPVMPVVLALLVRITRIRKTVGCTKDSKTEGDLRHAMLTSPGLSARMA